MTSKSKISSDWGIVFLCFLGFLTAVGVILPGGSFLGDSFSKALYGAGSKIVLVAAILFAIGAVLFVFRRGIKGRSPSMVILLLGVLAFLFSRETISSASDAHLDYILHNQIRGRMEAGQQIVAACWKFAFDHRGSWPGTLEDLSPAYTSHADIQKAISDDSSSPGYTYIAPSVPNPPPRVVLLSSREVENRHHRYIVIYSDGSVQLEPKLFR